MKSETLQELLEEKINEVEELLLNNMLSNGNTEEECQRMCCMNKLKSFYHTVNGITDEDMK